MAKGKSTAVEEAAPSRRRSTRLSLGQSLQDEQVATATPVSVKSRGKKVPADTPTSSGIAKANGTVKGKAEGQTETRTRKRRSSVKSASKGVDEPEVESPEPEAVEEGDASDDEPSEPPAKRSRTSRTQKAAEETKPSKKNQSKSKASPPAPATSNGTTKKTQQNKQPAKATKSDPVKESPTNTTTTNGENGENSERNYWLLKAEPESRFENGTDVKFSIDDLASKTEPEPWDGIRNYVARNNLRAMKKGDLAFFYHSNCKEPGIVGTMEIVREHEADLSAHNPKAPYYDPKSKPSDPKWSVVFVEFRSKFAETIGLKELRSMGDAPGKPLANMQMLKQSRLSVSKVSPEEWEYLIGVAESRGKVITR